MNRFINTLMLRIMNVNKHRTTDSKQDARDRTTTSKPIFARHHRCIAEQKAYTRRIIRCLQSIYGKYRAQDATAQSDKGSCREKESTKTSNRIIHIPSFFFSFTFFQILQSIDDFCYHSNPAMFNYLLQLLEEYEHAL